MKVLATDFDGTLFRDRTITPADLNAIQRFRRAGNRFGIVTGRHYCSILEEVQKNNVPLDFLICCTGGILTDGVLHLLSEHRAPSAALRPLLEVTKDFNGMYFCLSRYEKRLWFSTGVPAPYDGVALLPDSALDTIDGFHEMGTRFETEEIAQNYTDTLNREYSHLVTAHRNGIYVDVCAPNTGKVSGLYEMLGLLGVPPQNLTVAGDNLNDLQMIREFSSFAVSSGRAELKAEANFVAPDIAAIVSHLL